MNKLARTLTWIAAGAVSGVILSKLGRKKERAAQDDPLKGSGTAVLETERLILRPFTLDDAVDMYENWAKDPEVTRFLQWQPHKDAGESLEILRDWVSQYEKGNYYNWAIELKELEEPIGSISVVQQNDRALQAHVGYCLGKEWWHRGIMSEALSAVIGYLFSEGYRRIDSRHNVANPHSGDVMKKCGMQYEATLRQRGWDNSGIHDEALYSILAQDYTGGDRP